MACFRPTEEEGDDMLTVKVTKQLQPDGDLPLRFSTKIVETEHVDIYTLRPGELYEVAGGTPPNSFAFLIAPRGTRPEGFADEVDFWYQAFIENSAGATTEVVKF